jgi:hypothetical protein
MTEDAALERNLRENEQSHGEIALEAEIPQTASPSQLEAR